MDSRSPEPAIGLRAAGCVFVAVIHSRDSRALAMAHRFQGAVASFWEAGDVPIL